MSGQADEGQTPGWSITQDLSTSKKGVKYFNMCTVLRIVPGIK